MAAQTFRRSKIEKVYDRVKVGRDELAKHVGLSREIAGRVAAFDHVLYLLREEFGLEDESRNE